MFKSASGINLGLTLGNLRRFSSESLWNACTEDDHRQAETRPSQRRREQFLLGRALTRRLLPPGPWLIRPDCEGRPQVLSTPWQMSVSHAGDWVVAAIAQDTRIGVDIEIPKPHRPVQDMAAAYWSEAEYRSVQDEGEAAFLAYWTLREAVAKAEGGGMTLALGLDGAKLMPARGSETVFGAWRVAHREAEGVHLALAFQARG